MQYLQVHVLKRLTVLTHIDKAHSIYMYLQGSQYLQVSTRLKVLTHIIFVYAGRQYTKAGSQLTTYISAHNAHAISVSS